MNYIQQIKEVICNCKAVREDKEIHIEARDLAEFVIKDLEKILHDIQVKEGSIQ
jgi:hypothetical protein